MSTFGDLHVPGRPFVLVNAWDVASALLLTEAGHPAIGTTSLGLTAAAGHLDGARAGLDLTADLVQRLHGRLRVPLTVDLEDGFSDEPGEVAELCARLAARGAAGVNLEDGRRPAAAHARVVAAVKAAVPELFVNARTDVFWSGDRYLSDALERLRAYRDAGADGLFVPGLTDLGGLSAAVAVGPPVNALWQPGVDLAAVGVARISTGSALHRIAMAAAVDAAAAARDGRDPRAAVGYDDLQDLLRRPGRRPT